MSILNNIVAFGALLVAGTCAFWWLGFLMCVWFGPTQTTYHGPIEPNPFRSLRYNAIFLGLTVLSLGLFLVANAAGALR
jgi:hypothetical protein